MSEPRVILQVVMLSDATMDVKLGTQHEALLALAIRKASLAIDDCLLQHQFDKELKEKSRIEIPKTVSNLLR